MKMVRKLDLKDHPGLRTEPLIRLLNILNCDGINARMVGGCVRDALLGQDITDIDLACCLAPEETMSRLEQAGVKVIPIGLKHGTITAVMGKSHFEITSLRRDVTTDGRHAKVAFIDDWVEDARRRDFTVNALYLDGDGSLYDPCFGLDDIAARRVRFIGDATERIREDALRILRFFRFTARIGRGNLDSAGLRACTDNRHMIDRLSGERLAQEMFKILEAENPLPVITVMADKGILSKIIAGHNDLKDFKNYVRREHESGRCDSLARLACLVTADRVDSISQRLKLSRKQADRLDHFCRHDIVIAPDIGKKDIRKGIYLSGREVVIFALLHQGITDRRLEYADNWPVPIFPLRGRDLTEVGFKAGPKLGQILKQLDKIWRESDFSLTRDQLIAHILAGNAAG